jgi:hypothetical protein
MIPMMDLPALTALMADLDKLVRAAKLMKSLQWDIGHKLSPAYKGAFTTESFEGFLGLFHLTPAPTRERVLADPDFYLRVLCVLESVWTDLGPYPPTKDRGGKGMASSETWGKVASFFDFDDSE